MLGKIYLRLATFFTKHYVLFERKHNKYILSVHFTTEAYRRMKEYEEQFSEKDMLYSLENCPEQWMDVAFSEIA